MITFKQEQTEEEKSGFFGHNPVNKIEMEILEGTDLPSLLESFTYFLKAISFQLPEGDLEFVNEDKEFVIDREEYEKDIKEMYPNTIEMTFADNEELIKMKDKLSKKLAEVNQAISNLNN